MESAPAGDRRESCRNASYRLWAATRAARLSASGHSAASCGTSCTRPRCTTCLLHTSTCRQPQCPAVYCVHGTCQQAVCRSVYATCVRRARDTYQCIWRWHLVHFQLLHPGTDPCGPAQTCSRCSVGKHRAKQHRSVPGYRSCSGHTCAAGHTAEHSYILPVYMPIQDTYRFQHAM